MDPAIPEHKVVVMGGGGVGKSSLTIRFVTDDFLDEYDPTIEDSYRKQVCVDGKPVLLDILDTAGQEEFDSMQDQWIREGKAFLLVYSIISRSSFDDVILLREKILRNKEDEKTKAPIILVGNKCDLEDMRQVDKSEARKVAEEWGACFFESSAKSRINNTEIFYQCIKEIRKLKDSKKDDDDKKRKKPKICLIL